MVGEDANDMLSESLVLSLALSLLVEETQCDRLVVGGALCPRESGIDGAGRSILRLDDCRTAVARALVSIGIWVLEARLWCDGNRRLEVRLASSTASLRLDPSCCCWLPSPSETREPCCSYPRDKRRFDPLEASSISRLLDPRLLPSRVERRRLELRSC